LLTPAGAAVLAEASAVYAAEASAVPSAGRQVARGEDRGAAAPGLAARELAVGARLRAEGVPADLVAAAFAQAELRQRAAAKFTLADRMFFTRAGLEQASSQAAAEHRAARLAGCARVADLCTGIGGDASALGPGRQILLVDRDPVHLRMAALNAGVHGAGQVETWLGDVREADLGGVDGVFVDPARRSGDRRLGSGACEPPLPWCFALAGTVGAVAVKAAPGIDLAQVPAGWEVEFVADGRDLKEAVLFSPTLATTARRATVLGTGVGPGAGAQAGVGAVSLVGTPDLDPGSGFDPVRPSKRAVRIAGPGRYLYDPSPAVTRAGLVGELARGLGAWQLDPMIAFLSSDLAVATPFARLLRIESHQPFDVRRLAADLRTRGIGSLDIRRRGLAGDVDTLRRRLLPRRRDLLPGGPAVTVVMTRLRDEPWALICVPASVLPT